MLHRSRNRFRSIVLIMTLFFSAVALKAQVITITFEGTLNGSSIPLDSIRVMNLTAGGDTMIYYPDNLLMLGATGLGAVADRTPVLRNQPNPFAYVTDILLGTGRSGKTLLQVHDATGREVAAYAGSLAVGQHRFLFNAATPGVHVLTVQQGGTRAMHRLVALAGEASGSGLTYAGGSGAAGVVKSDRSLFTWTPGDGLRYIGYATDAGIAHSAAIDEVPVASATRTFELFEGLACPEAPTVTDIDGNVYRNVRIGTQCWMAENLRTTRYDTGGLIPNVTVGTVWGQLSTAAWCDYQNDVNNDIVYGKLYNWYAVSDPNICPSGWHVSTDIDWQQIEAAMGMTELQLGNQGMRGEAENVGGRLKATTMWSEPNTGATNSSGLSGFPGGSCSEDAGYFGSMGLFGFWWTGTEFNTDNAYSRNMLFSSGGISRPAFHKQKGSSVRCVMD